MLDMAYLSKAFGSAAIAVWITWIAAQTGCRLLALMPLSPIPTRFERLAIGSGLGFGLLSFFTLFLGVLGLWYPAVFWVTLGSWTICLVILRGSKRGTKEKRLSLSSWERIWASVLALFFFLYFTSNLTPEIFYDSLFYHLAVPNLYRIAHRLYDIPTLLFSNFVQTIQMLYGLAITVGTAVTAKWLHALLGLALAGALVTFGRRFLSPGAGWLAAAIFFSLPAVGLGITTSSADLAWSVFQFLAGYALILGLEDRSRGWMPVAGVLAGFSASCKYPGLAWIPIAGLLILWQRRWDEKRPWDEVTRDLAGFLIPAFLVITPMLARNVAFHGNPVYPFGATFLGHPRLEPHRWQLFLSDAGTPRLAHEFSQIDSALRYLLRPWVRILRGSQPAFFLNPLFLLYFPLLFFRRKPPAALLTLRRGFVGLWLVWMLSNPTPRYGLPALTFLAPLAAEITLSFEPFRRIRGILLAAWVASFAVNFYRLSMIQACTEGWKVLTGRLSEAAYLREEHATYPTPPYAAIEWMNNHLPRESKVLFIGEARTYYMERAAIPSGVVDPQPLVELSKKSRSARELAHELRQMGVTHLSLSRQESERTAGYNLFSMDRASAKRLQDFWAHHAHPLWSQEGLEVYQLLPHD